VLNQCPGIGDIILQAFIARRQLLRESPNFIGLRVIGSRYSPDTFRVRDFLARNRVLFTWTDLEAEPQVDRLLQEFSVTAPDAPSRRYLLSNQLNLALTNRCRSVQATNCQRSNTAFKLNCIASEQGAKILTRPSRIGGA